MFDLLPNEVLCQIFSHLNLYHLTILEHVCSRFESISHYVVNSRNIQYGDIKEVMVAYDLFNNNCTLYHEIKNKFSIKTQSHLTTYKNLQHIRVSGLNLDVDFCTTRLKYLKYTGHSDHQIENDPCLKYGITYKLFTKKTYQFIIQNHYLSLITSLQSYDTNKENTYVCDYFAKYDNFLLLQEFYKLKFNLSNKICVYASKNNNFAMLKWGHKKFYGEWNYKKCIKYALFHQNYVMLCWLLCNDHFPEDKHVYLLQYAAKYDHLGLIKIYYPHIITKPKQIHAKINKLIYDNASKSGNLNILLWMRKNTGSWNVSIVYNAVKYGHTHILEHAKMQKCPWNEFMYDKISNETKMWINQNGYPWNPNIISFLKNHNLDNVITYGKKNGIAWNLELTNNNECLLNILKWLKEINFFHSYDAIKYITIWAINHGDLDILDWLIINGLIVKKLVCNEAIRNNNFEMLKWARQNGCKWNDISFGLAVQHCSIELIEWMYGHQCPINKKDKNKMCFNAYENNKYDTLKWLIDHQFCYDQKIKMCNKLYHLTPIVKINQIVLRLYQKYLLD